MTTCEKCSTRHGPGEFVTQADCREAQAHRDAIEATKTLLAPLQAIQANLDLIAFLPDWLETLAIPLVPGLIVYVSGYVTKHEPRPDLPASQR